MSWFPERLRERARSLQRRIVLAEGHDERTLRAAAELVTSGIAKPVVLGPVEPTRAALARLGAPADAVEVIDPASDARRAAFAAELAALRRERGLTIEAAAEHVLEPLVFAALLLRAGAVDGSVAGAANPTAAVLRAALWCVGPAPGIRTVSSAFYMVVRDFRGRGEEVLTFTDAGVVPEPGPEELADIAVAAADARRDVVGDEPRLAFLSYSTHGSAAGPGIEKVREGLRRFRQRRPDVAADGELQADAALIAGVAERKAPDSPIHGDANVLVFPDLDAGNIAYKLVQRLAGAAAFGPIVQGLAKPCNDLSRGASSDDIVNVACITALQAGSG